ncbi:dephospho-CoA kinase CoaE [Streptococcus dysgalactiae subsp. equisimilis]|uniref:Dephospho-CoA kinase n=2 Tax=Streptococcus dysgalactiae subsp. equisimilis TaxID=119602 RepID=A0A9X8T4E6_STREQ|nr:dephospho-CoA kinase CoaE [Streptococcus dysgalactiae subsp. equisimilis]VTY14893.1 Dephospho-CoA kinase [Streptococcus dysgalactiae]BAM60662.1 dephospho-CoA kinase [Streptococcus dysgalactiae subsp. equisimilis RE378]SUN64293.1 dephospho-CoA kinase [Streptococcus dysgalactiae subsp. equisimilis]VTS19111.1 dephospho-CoA kinase [Streptococcus dysgalactiae subsp. equisimilis]
MSEMSEKKVLMIGITGGIASGKSTVVAMIKEAGYQVIDADQVVHQLQEKGGRLYEALKQAFGNEILKEDGDLNRKKLSEMVFSNPSHMATSSAIQNQIIKEELAAERDQLAQSQTVIFMDIPLLIELGYQDWFDAIWLVYVDAQTQLRRLMARNHLREVDAKKRLSSQLSIEEKRPYASLVIDNSGDMETLRKQVHKALEQLSKPY